MKSRSVSIIAVTAFVFLSGCGSPESKARSAFEGTGVPDMRALELREVNAVKDNGISYLCGMVRYGETGDFKGFVIEGDAEPTVGSLVTVIIVSPQGCFSSEAMAEQDRLMGINTTS